MKELKPIKVYKISDRVILWLGRSSQNTKTGLCELLGMSKPTLDRRIREGGWNKLEVERLQELEII